MTTAFRRTLRAYADRAKVWAFLASILLLGLGVGSSISAYFANAESTARYAAYDRQVMRLTDEIAGRVDRVSERVESNVRLAEANAVTLAKLLETAEEAAVQANAAARTASSAATTAKGAARNAAKSTIRIKEIPAAKAAPAPVKTREVEP